MSIATTQLNLDEFVWRFRPGTWRWRPCLSHQFWLIPTKYSHDVLAWTCFRTCMCCGMPALGKWVPTHGVCCFSCAFRFIPDLLAHVRVQPPKYSKLNASCWRRRRETEREREGAHGKTYTKRSDKYLWSVHPTEAFQLRVVGSGSFTSVNNVWSWIVSVHHTLFL